MNFAFSVDDGECFYVMELVEGETGKRRRRNDIAARIESLA